MLVAKIFFNCLARVYARARARVAFAGYTSLLPSLRYGACFNLLRKSKQGNHGWFFLKKNLNTAKRSVAVRLFPDGEGLSEGQAFPLPGSAKKMRWCRVRACPCVWIFRTEPGHRFRATAMERHCNGAAFMGSLPFLPRRGLRLWVVPV